LNKYNLFKNSFTH